jgi:hypothetical protein
MRRYRAMANIKTPWTRKPPAMAPLCVAHEIQPQVFAELRLVGRVELGEADPDHGEAHEPDQDPAQRRLVG